MPSGGSYPPILWQNFLNFAVEMENIGLKPGTLLRHSAYRVEKTLGFGGFGITYLATDLNLDRLVAIKEFFPQDLCHREGDTSAVVSVATANAPDTVEKLKAKFIKEAKNIAKLDHPGIIKIHSAFEENNTAYYVMDFIEGQTLFERVETDGPLPTEDALEIITAVGEALEYIHSHNINHLDVKPENIMLRHSDGKPILIDFGLSKHYDKRGKQTTNTLSGLSHGYAPIEQYNVEGIKEFSPQTDVYSLAATLYYALSGTVPPNATDIIINEGLDFPDDFPQQLVPAISRGMASTAKSRYSTAGQFINAVNGSPDFYPDSTSDYEADYDFSELNDSDSYSKKKALRRWGGIVAGLVLLVGLFIVLAQTHSSEPAEPTAAEMSEPDSLPDEEVAAASDAKESGVNKVAEASQRPEARSADEASLLKVEKQTSEANGNAVASNEAKSLAPVSAPQETKTSEQIYSVVEQPAEFPGGQTALMKWLANNMRYPESAQQNGVSGRVIVKFVVEKNGTLSGLEIAKGIDKDLDSEALRIVRRMPAWTPARVGGQPVRSSFTLPIIFRLQ